MTFHDTVTIGEKYEPAMALTDQAEADAYFEACVEHCQRRFDKTRQEAEAIERANLGYYAGYFSNETRRRVERLFRCSHPIFGAIAEKGAPSPTEAFRLGYERGKNSLGEEIKEKEED
jgi:hypothetical protein